MRKIAQPSRPHNAGTAHRTTIVLACAALLGGAFLPGCQKAERAAPTTTHVAQGCALVVDTSALASFWAAADRLQGAAGTPSDEIGATLVQNPAWRLWCRSFTPQEVSPAQLGLLVRASVLGEGALTRAESTKLGRREAMRSQAFTLAQRARVVPFLDDLIANETVCAAWANARPWIRSASLPDTLRVDFVAGNAEIRLFEDHFLVDAGLAYICGGAQLTRMLASVLYTRLEAPAGPSPGDATGDAVLAHSLRLIRNEGIAGYIDDLPALFFGREHPVLGGTAPVPEDLAETALGNLANIERTVALQLTAAPQARDFTGVHSYLVGSRGWRTTGWYMAAVIARQLGEPRLQAASRTVTGFFAAYQEAAAAATPDAAAPPGSLDRLLTTPTVFSAPVFAVLQDAAGLIP